MTAFKWGKKSGRRNREAGFLARMRRDQKGNALAIMAAALIPMIGMVGSAVDISRAYLVKTRLQQACDAGVLAARRTMTGTSVANDTNAKAQATNFFNMNLKTGAYGSTVTSIVVSDVNDSNGNPSGTITGSASASVPTTLMKIFKKPTITMNVTCDAEMHISNQDVMFVLDVTGSMNCAAGGGFCNPNFEASNSKIAAVRTGVVEFYDTLNTAMTQGSRLRIGIMPYSSNVNVGRLLPASYIVDSWTYQSRQRTLLSYDPRSDNYGSWTTISTGSWGSWQNNTTSNVRSGNCSAPGLSTSYGAVTTTTGTVTTDPNSLVKSTPLSDQRTATDTQYQWVSWTKTGTDSRGRDIGDCVIKSQTRQRTEQRTGTGTEDPNFTWTYGPVTYDTSQFKLGNSVTTRTGSNFSNDTSVWDGCIEERQTVSNATFSSIPSDAYDLQIDLLPTSDITRWKPHWPDIVYDRSTLAAQQDSSNHTNPSGSSAACPKQALKLAVMTHADVYNYVNASDFRAIGGTYHDVGMIWGGRFLSPTGIFSAENTTAPNGEPINRNIIFMTDGAMAPQPTIDGLYGYEKLDRRISGIANTPGDPDLTNRHNSRFSAICEAIKGLGITIWVVAYDQSMTTELQNCASGTGTDKKAYYAANDTQMKAALQAIASQIAELRLSR